MEIDCMSIRAQRLNVSKTMEGCWHDLLPQPVPQLIILQYWLFAQQSYKPAQDCQLKFQLICWNLGGGTSRFAASDISSILWVKCCLGNSEGVDCGERHCEEALELFCQKSAEQEVYNRRKEEQRMLAIRGKKIRSKIRQLLKRFPWSSFALCVSISKFFVSFCLIRNSTMFSLVKKLKQWRKQWYFPSIFSLKCYQLAFHASFFLNSPWHLNKTESTLWNLWLKKEVISITVPQETPVCFEPLKFMVCPMPYLSPVLLNHRELHRLQTEGAMPERVSCLFPGSSFNVL